MTVNCTPGCGACCIAPSISSPIPGMPTGKPAGVRCVQLDQDNHCLLFGRPQRPKVCLDFSPTEELCSDGAVAALQRITFLERATS